MPTYNYKCNYCQNEYTMFHNINHVETECPKCDKGELKKTFNKPPSISFKGSGFYTNDYS